MKFMLYLGVSYLMFISSQFFLQFLRFLGHKASCFPFPPFFFLGIFPPPVNPPLDTRAMKLKNVSSPRPPLAISGLILIPIYFPWNGFSFLQIYVPIMPQELTLLNACTFILNLNTFYHIRHVNFLLTSLLEFIVMHCD